MAADLGHVKPVPVTKHEAFVEAQLRKVRTRIRLYDTAAGLLGFVLLTLLCVLGIVLWDRLLGMASGTRLLVWGAYAVLALVYLAATVARPLLRPINPYFAARQVEQTLPDAKNSVINWLDLRQRRLPPAIHQSLGYRAARDLTAFDIDRALSARQTVVLGLLTVVVGVALGVSLSIFRPTSIDLIEPDGDHNLTVPMHQSISFRVQVGGRVPSPDDPERALKLLFRYHDDEPYQERVLERGESDREWQTRMPPSMVHSDLFYKVVGGHAETPEYQVRIQPPPLLTGRYDVTLRYPYLGSKPETEAGRSHANLKAVQGTDVTLVAFTNSPVKQGYLECAQGEHVGEVLPRSDPQAVTFRFVLDRDPASGAPVLTSGSRRVPLDLEGSLGKYRIRFEATDGQRNLDPIPYTVEVTTDLPPTVLLEKPTVEKLPTDGVLELKGRATDDHGLTRMTLKRQVIDGGNRRDLPPVPYREGKFRVETDGTYLRDMPYKDVLDLRKLAEDPAGFRLQPDQELEFWLEAADDFTYPGPHVTPSSHFRLKLEASAADRAKLEEERRRIEQDKSAHEKALDKQLAEENRERRGEPRPEEKKDQQRKDEELKKEVDRLKEAVKEVEKEQKKPGEGKGESPPKPDKNNQGQGNKPDSQAKPDNKGEAKPDAKPDSKDQKGEAKPQPQPGPAEKKNEKAQEKGPGKQDEKGQGEAKPDRNPDAKPPKPEAKDGAGKRDGKGEQKGSGNKDSKDAPDPQGKGKPKGKEDAGKGKGAGQSDPANDNEDKGPGQPDRNASDDGKGKGKGDPKAQGKGEKSDNKGPDKGSKKGEGQADGDASKGDGGEKGKEKPAAGKPKGDEPAKGQAKGPGGERTNDQPKPGDMGEPDVAEIAKGLKDADKGKREDAARKLTDIAANDKDPAVRKAAQDALDKAGTEPGAAKDDPKGPGDQKDGDGQKPDGAGKGNKAGPGEGKEGAGSGKPGSEGQAKGGGAGKAEGGQGDKGEGGQGKGGAKGGQSKGGGGQKGGAEKDPDSPSGESGGGGRSGAAAAGQGDEGTGMAPDARYKKIAGDLKLEDFRKQVTDKVLEKAGMTRDELDQVIRDLEQLKQPVPASAGEPEAKTAPESNQGTLPNQGARRVDPATRSSGKAQRGGPAQPPSDLLKAQQDFSEKLRQLKNAAPK